MIPRSHGTAYALVAVSAMVAVALAYEPGDAEASRLVERAEAEPIAEMPQLAPATRHTCSREVWPYMSAECLEAVGVAHPREQVRIVRPKTADSARRLAELRRLAAGR
jgi:hypothetical protein